MREWEQALAKETAQRPLASCMSFLTQLGPNVIEFLSLVVSPVSTSGTQPELSTATSSYTQITLGSSAASSAEDSPCCPTFYGGSKRNVEWFHVEESEWGWSYFVGQSEGTVLTWTASFQGQAVPTPGSLNTLNHLPSGVEVFKPKRNTFRHGLRLTPVHAEARFR